MKRSGGFIAGFALFFLAFAVSASAQGSASMQVGNTTVTVGGGTAILDLPDVEFTKTFDENNNDVISGRLRDNTDFIDELGWNINGSVSTPAGSGTQLTLNGFFARIENDDSLGCTSALSGSATCIWVNIVGGAGANVGIAANQSAVVNSQRDVNFWGTSLEASLQLMPAVMGVTVAPHRRHVSVAADIRGIDQDITLRTADATGTARYDEELDTRYYGAYLAYGGEYSPFLFRGLWDRWDLKSSFKLRGGVYHADTNYSGRLFSNGAFGTINSRLSLSRDETAFIGGLALETSKQIGPRASLSLTSEYEYYSYVPDMVYNDNSGTVNGAQCTDAY